MKRLISIILCTSLAITSFASVASADGLTVGELTCDKILIKDMATGFGGNTLKADITYPSGDSEETSSFRWLSSDSADGEYTAMPSEKSAEYVVSSEMLGKFVKLEVTVKSGEKAESAPLEITSIGPWGEYAPGLSENTPDENVFTVDGQDFILLDYTASTSSKFFVMAKGSYGKTVFDGNAAAAGNQRFDAEKENTLAYMLNHEFKETGFTDDDGTYKLPDLILDNIDYNHTWVTEMGQETAGYTADTTQKCGIAVLSAAEAVKYKDKYGYKDGIFAQGTGYWLRTPMGAWKTPSYDTRVLAQSMWTAGKFGGVDLIKQANKKSCIRPVFYLDRSFFLKAGDAAKNKGKNVLAAMADVYTPEELGTVEKPVVGALSSDKGAEGFGGSLISAPSSNIEDLGLGKLTYSWQYSESADGEYKSIISENGKTYRVSPEMRGKYIRLEVSASGGKAYQSEPLYIDSIGPKGEQASISGSAANTPSENVFTIGGKQFILLDFTDDEDSAFFILAKNSYGAMQFNSNNISARNQAFDVNSENTLAHFLNNGFKTDGNNGAKLPEEILGYIDFNHAWVTEMGQPSAGYSADTVQNYGISVMSASEALKYAGKYGYKDDEFGQGANNAYWLRSPLGYAVKDAYKNRVLAQSVWSLGKIGAVDLASGKNTDIKLNIRPAFYLSRSFFKEQMANVSDMGENIILALKKVYSKAELAQMGIDSFDISISDTSAVQSGEDSVISFTVKSLLDENKPAKLIAALYSGGRLAAIKYDDYTVASGEEKAESVVFENAPYFDSYKIMLWDDDFSPLCLASAQSVTETPHLSWGASVNNIFTSDDPVCTAKVSFPLENAEAYSFAVTVDGVEKSYPFSAESGSLIAQADFGELTFAAHTVRGEIKRGGYTMLSQEREVNYVPRAADGFNAFGLCTSYSSASLNDFDYMKQMKLMGYTNMRLDFTWSKIETEKGVYDFSKYDKIVSKADEYGLDIMAIIDYNNNLYSGSDDERTGIASEENKAAYIAFAAAVADRYKSIKRFEIWNEPNGASFWKPQPDCDMYTRLCIEAAEKIKAVNPSARVYGGSLDIVRDPIDYLSDMLRGGVYKSLDGISYHPYFHPYSAENFYNQKIKTYRYLVNAYGGFKKLSANELDWLCDSSTLTYQASEVIKAAVILNANDITEGNYLNFRNYENSSGKSYGMENPDKSKRPLFFAAAQLNTVLKSSKFVCEVNTDNFSGYLFTSGKENILIAWGSGNLPYGNAFSRDMYGNIICSDNIELSENPIYAYGVDFEDFKGSQSVTNAATGDFLAAGDYENAIISLNAAEREIINGSGTLEEKSIKLSALYYDLKTIAMCAAADGIALNASPEVKAAENDYANAIAKYAEDYLTDSRKADGALKAALEKISQILYEWAGDLK